MIAQFALRLVCGMSLTWLLLPRRQISSGFFRIQMLVVMGLSVLACLSFGQQGGESDRVPAGSGAVLCGILAAVAFVASVLWTLERRFGATVSAVIIAAGSTTLLGLAALPGGSLGRSAVLIVASEWSAAFLLGATMVAMLLGHWYLTAPTMSHEPLRRANILFAAAICARLVLSSLGLVLGWAEVSSPTHWLWLSLRWSAGIIGPLLLAVMVWRILKYRNTQSATGVLVVGVILTFVGELSATLLSRELGMPF